MKNPIRKTSAVVVLACALPLLVPGSALANEKQSGTKSCPKGKEVIVESNAIGHIKHKFRSTKAGSKWRTHDFGSTQGYLLANRGTPTGLRSVKYTIYAWDVPGKLKGAKIVEKHISCY